MRQTILIPASQVFEYKKFITDINDAIKIQSWEFRNNYFEEINEIKISDEKFFTHIYDFNDVSIWRVNSIIFII